MITKDVRPVAEPNDIGKGTNDLDIHEVFHAIKDQAEKEVLQGVQDRFTKQELADQEPATSFNEK